MRIIISSAGTRSDLSFPFALAKKLQERKHTVTVVAPEKYRSEIMKMELRMVTCGRSFEDYLEGSVGDRSAELLKSVASQVASQFVALRDALRESDVLISGVLLIPAASMAEKLNLPFFQVIQSPLLLDPDLFPLHGVPAEKVSGLLGGRRKEALRRDWEEILGAALNREREFSHLQPIQNLQQHLFTGHQIIAVDPEIAAVEESSNRTVVGYSDFDFTEQLDERTSELLSVDRPTIYVGPLQVENSERETFLRMLCETVKASDCRVIVRSNFYGPDEKLPENCIAIDPANEFTALIRSTAAVHQGSSGFVMTCTRAAVPQVVVPFFVDDFYWAERVESLGLGPVKQTLDPKKIGDAAVKAINMREQVRAFSAKIENRDGITAACELIEKT